MGSVTKLTKTELKIPRNIIFCLFGCIGFESQTFKEDIRILFVSRFGA